MLQTLEAVFRNALHRSIGEALQKPEWILCGPNFFSPSEAKAVASAREDLKKAQKLETEPRIVAELHFGFWTSLADSRYDRLWPKIIKSAFPSMPNPIRTRGEVCARVNKVRWLRNAVFHHHSICKWQNLVQQHAEGYTIISWIDADLATLVKKIDRFATIHGNGPVAFKNLL